MQSGITEKGIQTIDREYLRGAISFFHQRKEGAMRAEHDLGERNSVSFYYESMTPAYQALARGEKIEDVDVAPILADALDMSHVLYQNEELDYPEETKRLGQQGKTLFMETYRKLNPDEEPTFGVEGSVSRARRRFESASLLDSGFASLAASFHTTERVLKSAKTMEEKSRIIHGDLYTITQTLGEESRQAFSRLQRGELTPEGYATIKKALLAAAEGVFQLMHAADHLEKMGEAVVAHKMAEATRQTVREGEVAKVQAIREGLAAPQARKVDFSQEPSLMSLKTVSRMEDIRKRMTPEVSSLLLSHLLHEVDQSIAQAERVMKGKQGILNKRSMAHIFGPGIQGEIGIYYEKILAAKSGRVYSPEEIARMPIAEYVKAAFGYELDKDSARAEALKKYTNVFD